MNEVVLDVGTATIWSNVTNRFCFPCYFLGRGQKEDHSSDSDSAVNEADSSKWSVMSNPSSPEEGASSSSAAGAGQDHKENGHQSHATEDDQSEIDDFEQKLELVLDQLQGSKSGRQRVQHFESLNKALTTRFCFDYFANR